MESVLLERAPLAPSERRSLRRRRILAHVLGWVGVLFTLWVAWLAFGKRAMTLVSAATAPSGHGELAPLVSALTPLVSALTPTAPIPAPPPPAAPAGSAADFPTAPSQPVAPTALPETDAERARASEHPSTPPASAAAPAAETPTPTGKSRVEPPLTPAEIRARKERYARWLSEQGLSQGEEPDPNAKP